MSPTSSEFLRSGYTADGQPRTAVEGPATLLQTPLAIPEVDKVIYGPTNLELDPRGLLPAAPGAKLDAGKVDILRGALQYFPRALKAIARVSELGAKKYSWKGWEKVPDGVRRYGAALVRHLLADNDESTAVDDGPGGVGPEVMHATQVAWNALARLELVLRRQEGL